MQKLAIIGVTLLAVFGSAVAQNDVDILNFALNLECLEAAYYSCAAYGADLSAPYLGEGGGPVTGCQQAALKGPALSYAQEIAQDELNHVRFLRVNLGNQSVPCPAIDLGPAFAALSAAAYNTTSQSPAFSPYFDVFNFILGAYVFEDVGVTAYKWAAPYILNRGILAAAASILGTESYHAGIIRAQVAQVADIPLQQTGTTVGEFADRVSALRQQLSGVEDVGITSPDGTINLVTRDSNGIALGRSPQEVLQIVYGTGSALSPGLFFPQGVNGYFSPLNLVNGK